MKWLDWMVDLAGLFLWLGWRGFGAVPVSARPALTLASNLRPAGRRDSHSRWALPGLLLLLFCRAWIHHEFPSRFAEAAVWSPGAVAVTFRSDLFGRMLVFSVLSWLLLTLQVYLAMAVFAGLRRKAAEADPITRSLRAELGWLARWPGFLGALPVLSVIGILWAAGAGSLAELGLIPPLRSEGHRYQQALVVALGLLPSLKWSLTAACLMRFLLDHVYLGSSAFWDFAQVVGGRLCSWLSWMPLRIGAIDFRPLFAAGAFWAAAYFLEGAVPRLFQRLPF